MNWDASGEHHAEPHSSGAQTAGPNTYLSQGGSVAVPMRGGSSARDDRRGMETARVEVPPLTAERLLQELAELRKRVVAEGDELLAQWRPALERRAFLPSAVNLACYIALRRRDLRPQQEALMPLGLSSLGRCEARVLQNLDSLRALHSGWGKERP